MLLTKEDKLGNLLQINLLTKKWKMLMLKNYNYNSSTPTFW